MKLLAIVIVVFAIIDFDPVVAAPQYGNIASNNWNNPDLNICLRAVYPHPCIYTDKRGVQQCRRRKAECGCCTEYYKATGR